MGFRMYREGGRQARFLAAALGALALILTGPADGQDTIFDPRFDEVRRASVVWDNRRGPRRDVVDTVCLVPDLPTFFEAVSAWDEGHYFPVLIDDVEYTLKFLRAFRPSRVVRYPSRASPDDLWEKAVGAVGKAWSAEGVGAEKVPRGDAVPAALGPVPPGVVISAPDSPTLAGAVALAAGRFQPLLKWEAPWRSMVQLSADDARSVATDLEKLIAARFPHYDRLGDDCDFVTLAGDYPYRYNQDGTNALDDLFFRPSKNGRRWAFAGRLTGDATRSAYQAMCSLFLHPSSALLFNTYSEKERPWSEYAMGSALDRLSPLMKVNLRNGDRAALDGWHQAFDPVNPYGLLLINTSGNPTSFSLGGGPGHTADIPESVPTAVLIIHSFSAETPEDPETLAGRWMANGAFAYYGAVYEPYLQAFRPPGLIATYLRENLPVVVAVRRGEQEVQGFAWRLAYFGDPLYRVKATETAARLTDWKPLASWPAYTEYLQPGPEAPDTLRFRWALKTAIFLTQTGTAPQQRPDLATALRNIARDRLEPAWRPVYDDLLADVLLQAGRRSDLIDRLSAVPPGERTPSLRRHLETAQTSALQSAAEAKDLRQAMALWGDVVRAPGSRDFAATFTTRVGAIAGDDPSRLVDWRDRLASALRSRPDPSNLPVIKAELTRVTDRVAAAKKP